MGPGRSSSISSEAVPSYGTRILLHYEPRGYSKLWVPDTASLSAQRLFRLMGRKHCSIICSESVPSYGTRTLLYEQLQGCSVLWDPNTAPLTVYRLFQVMGPATAPLSAPRLFQVMGPGHCSIISSEAVPSYGTQTLLYNQLRVCSELWDMDTDPLTVQRLFQVMGPGHCFSISSESVPSYGSCPLSAQRVFILSYGKQALFHDQLRGCLEL